MKEILILQAFREVRGQFSLTPEAVLFRKGPTKYVSCKSPFKNALVVIFSLQEHTIKPILAAQLLGAQSLKISEQI